MVITLLHDGIVNTCLFYFWFLSVFPSSISFPPSLSHFFYQNLKSSNPSFLLSAEKGEKKYGKFNTVSRALGQLHYGNVPQRQKIELPPPVSSAMLFQRNHSRASFGLLRGSGVFKKRRPKARRENKITKAAEEST